MSIISFELEEVSKICSNVVPGSKIIACSDSLVRVDIKQTESRQLTACLRFPNNYPDYHILVEFKSRTLSGKFLDGLTKLSEQKTEEILGKPQNTECEENIFSIKMDIELLISEVRNRRCLWDVRCKEYKNRTVLKAAWEIVAHILDADIDIVKKKWKSLRDNYRTELIKLKKKNSSSNAASPLYQTKWCYFPDLDFLRDSFTPAKRRRYLNEKYPIQKWDDIKSEKHIEIIDTPQVELPPPENSSEDLESTHNAKKPETSTKIDSPMKRKISCDESRFLEIEEKKLSLMKADYDLKRDENFNFLMSLLPQMQKMPVSKNLQFRMQIIHVLKFVSQYLNENPLCVVFDEIFALKQLLKDPSDLKLKQKTSSVVLCARGGKYFFKIKVEVPIDYPKNCIVWKDQESNLPAVLLRYLNGQSKEIARQCVEAPLNPKKKGEPFIPRPSFLKALKFIVEATAGFADEKCPICNDVVLPEQPENGVKEELDPLFIERVYCGHLYHQGCLKKYMHEPPFPVGGKVCPATKRHPRPDSVRDSKSAGKNANKPTINSSAKGEKTCGILLAHDRWVVNVKVAEARWAQKQARERELEEVVDFLN